MDEIKRKNRKDSSGGILNSRTVLLVEDDVAVRDMYSVGLRQEGYEVKTMENGVQALEWLDKNTPDIVLLDIMMPFMDGIETLTEIRKNPSLKDVPVVMLTNLSESQDVTRALASGANDYLIKTKFTPSELAAKVNDLYWEFKK